MEPRPRIRRTATAVGLGTLVVSLAILALPPRARGQGMTGPPAKVGELGSLIPFHKDAIHAGLMWREETSPRICFWMRPAEWRGSDLVDASVIDPDDRNTFVDSLREEFERIVFGGFRFGTGPHGLDESVATRIFDDIPRDQGLCLDLTHPDALFESGKFDVRELDAADFARNAPALSNAGHSMGLDYNIFCAGNVALADGRWFMGGGHDKAGNNGIRKLTIFDPDTGWVERVQPPVKLAFLADPDGDGAYPSANDETNTDPKDPSDMRYQRWYPSAVALPDGRVLILSGTDQDSSDPATASLTKVRVATPEVYDPDTDRSTPLENARRLFAMYPRSYVVQTGQGRDDWRVAVISEVDETKLPQGDDLRGYDPWTYTGRTLFLDVLGALADPGIDDPASNHWTHVATAEIAHDGGAGAALWELDGDGHPRSQKVVLFGGGCGDNPDTCDQRTVEMIDFSDPEPRWRRQQDLAQPVSQNNAVVLPTGEVLVIGGSRGRGPWQNSFRYQLFDPETGRMRTTAETTIPRHDHSTAALLPNGSVIAMGGNRTDLANDVGELHRGVPVAQIYRPPYFFIGRRPVVRDAPARISYGDRFTIELGSGPSAIRSVSLVRHGPVTHNWDWGNRFVRLSFERGPGRSITAAAPAVPGAAVPGYYMLFVVDQRDVPSLARLVRLG